MKRSRWIHLLLLIISLAKPDSFVSAQSLVINEFLASNDSVNFDSDRLSGDWIEIYNAGMDTVDLTNLWLTDDPAVPDKWIFPVASLPPQAFLLVWATGKDLTGSEWHSNFKLNAGGEFIGLYHPDGAVIDTLSFTDQSTDVSYGRYPDGSENWQFMPTPSPAGKNIPDGIVPHYKIKFSHPSNIYSQGIRLEMQTIPPGGEIHFTTDGAAPTYNSRVYESRIDLNYISVIRARVFSGTVAKSTLKTRTYIVHDTPRLPVISLVTDPANLWDPQTGIYANWDKQGDNWERPARIRLIENGESKFSAPVGVRIHGNSSRSVEKKNFRVYFRSEYGEADLDYQLFPQKTTKSFKRLILYAPSGDQATGASNWNMLHDVLVHALFKQMGGIVSGWKPVALYLNEQYWGIYWLRERVDKFFVQRYLGFSDIDLMRTSRSWQPDLRVGDRVYWDETFDFFKKNSPANASVYQTISDQYLSIEQFTDYQLINIFSGNWDWPDNNLDFTHDRIGPDPRWRYLLWDTAAAWRYPYDHLTLEWATRDRVRTDIKYNDKEEVIWTTLFLRRLLEHREYKNYFINRFADLLNTTFRADSVRALKDSLAAWIRPEIQREAERWNGGGIGTWENNQNVIDNFITRRPEIQRNHIKNVFSLSHSIKISIVKGTGEGQLKLNTLKLAELPWSGTYFAGIPVTLQAIAAPGYFFSGWTDTSLPADSILTVSRTANFSIGANFSQIRQEIVFTGVDSITSQTAIINWRTKLPATGEIELQSQTGPQLVFQDSIPSTEHAFKLHGLQADTEYDYTLSVPDPAGGTVSKSGSFRTQSEPEPIAIVAVSIDSISERAARVSWQTSVPGRGRVNFGADSSMQLYRDSSPNFQSGHSLWLDNLQAGTTYWLRITAWAELSADSSRSAIIAFTTKNPLKVADDFDSKIPDSFIVSQNFPNPFILSTRIRLHIPKHGQLSGQIFNVNGRRIFTFPVVQVQPGIKNIIWRGLDTNGHNCPSGIYLLRLIFMPETGATVTRKRQLLLLK